MEAEERSSNHGSGLGRGEKERSPFSEGEKMAVVVEEAKVTEGE